MNDLGGWCLGRWICGGVRYGNVIWAIGFDDDNDIGDDDELRPSTSSCCARSIVPSSITHTNFP